MNVALAHLSDPHLPVPAGALRPLSQLAGKRSLAYLGWLRKRAGTMPPGPLLADIAAHGPDHVAVTGDLTNLALPGEFAAAREWLARLGPPARVTAIPGNHDATVPVPWEEGIGRWRPWMADGDGGPGGGGAPRFPFLRRRGPLALLGLSSAVPTLPGSAAGWLGADQLARLPPLLEEARREGLFRVVLVHHPPLPGPGGWRRALRDRGALRAVLRRSGAELVLHGHHHAVLRAAVDGPAGPIPVLGAPLALRARRGEPAGWHLHRVALDGTGGWTLETVVRAWDAAAGAFRTAQAWMQRVSSGDGPSCASRPAAR